jgi:hypothetical protein
MPFIYPKSKHKRKLTPCRYTKYQSYKPYLQTEFNNKCVYCMTPDTLNNYNNFGVDHYRPKTIFPELINEYSNLFYCCNKCNSLKGHYWPKTGREHLFIPNPCDHTMTEHLKFKDDLVYPKTDAGSFTVETLCLNDDKVVSFRQFLIVSKKALISQLYDLESTLKEIESRISTSKDLNLKELLSEKCLTIKDIQNIKNSIMIVEGIKEINTTSH